MAGKPLTHADAELILKVYDTRREPVMREARQALNQNFWPKSFGDVMEVASSPQHPLNSAFRQCGTYWEMVYSFVRHGIVHPEFWLENNGEGLFLLAKIEPWLAELREAAEPQVFRNAEWVARECPDGKPVYERIKARTAKMAAAYAGAR